MSSVAETPAQAIMRALMHPAGVGGVHAHTEPFERVIDGLVALITRQREPGTEVLRYPPVMSRAHLERSGYLHSFPHLLGCVCALHGREPEVRALVEGRNAGRNWTDGLAATDLVLTPAACYPLYPMAAARGRLPAEGLRFDVSSYCFRHEASHEPGRLQSFRMREFVCMGEPAQAVDFRARWMPRAEAVANELALPYRLLAASDPFFGRAGKIMAQSQVEQELKFELLIPVNSVEEPTACMSFNYHQDHFGTIWDLQTSQGQPAHTACVAFGIDRLALALFATHGLSPADWPAGVRAALSL